MEWPDSLTRYVAIKKVEGGDDVDEDYNGNGDGDNKDDLIKPRSLVRTNTTTTTVVVIVSGMA